MHNENTAFDSCEELVLFCRKLSSLSTEALRQKIQFLMDLGVDQEGFRSTVWPSLQFRTWFCYEMLSQCL